MYYYHTSPLVIRIPIKKTLIFDTKLHAMKYLVREYLGKSKEYSLINDSDLDLMTIEYISKLFNLKFNEKIDDNIFTVILNVEFANNKIEDYKKNMYITECKDQQKNTSILDVHIKQDNIFVKLKDYKKITKNCVTYNNFLIEHIDMRIYLLSLSLGYEYIMD